MKIKISPTTIINISCEESNELDYNNPFEFNYSIAAKEFLDSFKMEVCGLFLEELVKQCNYSLKDSKRKLKKIEKLTQKKIIL